MPKKNPKYTSEVMNKMIEMADSGIPYKEISKQLGISLSVISQKATEQGIRRYETTRSFNEHR